MKRDILNKLRELTESEDVLQKQKEFNQLSSQMKSLLAHGISDIEDGEEPYDEEEEEFEKASAPEPEEAVTEVRNEAEEESDATVKSDSSGTPSNEQEETQEDIEAIRAHFNELVSSFREKVKKARESKEKLEKETIQEAKSLIQQLKALVENEENIGKAFSGFNEIRDKWKALPGVSNDAYRDLNAEYNQYTEKFFYNINIYKELKELDLKHNLAEKQVVLEDQKKILDQNDIRLMEVEVRLNQDRWNEIGPTFREDWEKLKEEFWTVTKAIYAKIHDFYQGRRLEQEKNLEAKKALLERIRHITSLDLKSPKKWQDKTEEVIALQNEWKMIGFVAREHSTTIWREFRTLCDQFFDNKRTHFAEIRAVQDANKEAKMKLLEQAEALKDDENFRETADILIRLQKEWKEIGAAHQRDENMMWRRFRQACDHFFERKKENRSEQSQQEKENFDKKQELLEEIEKFEATSNKSETLEKLKEFGERWREIGHVPFNKKNEVNKRYKNLMDEKYNSLKIDQQEKQKLRFKERLENIKDAKKSDTLVRKEEDFIRNKISKLKAEKIQLENNMGFFANSKGADKLKHDVEKKIEKTEDEISALKEQLEMLKHV